MKSRNCFSVMLIACALVAFAPEVFATNSHAPPKPPAASASSADADAHASSTSSSRGGHATATGGHATGGRSDATARGGNATGGSSEQSQSAEGGSVGDVSSSSDNAQSFSSDDDTLVERSNPGVFLPAILVSGCGAGVNAGGASRNDAGALGITWTTERCYGLQSAINFFAIGDYETGCELLIDVNRAAFKRVKKPDCSKLAAAIVDRLEKEAAARKTTVVPDPVVTPDMSKYATVEQLNRAFKDNLSK